MQLHQARRAFGALLLALFSLLGAAAPLGAQEAAPPVLEAAPGTGVIHGVITTQTTIPLGGVAVSLFDGSADVGRLFTEGDGSFTFANLKPGRYTVTAVLENFEVVTVPAVVTAAQTTEVPFDLRLAINAEQVEVVAPNPVVPAAGTISSSEAVEKTELEQIAPGGGVQSALRLIAGVIELPGGIAIKGGRPSQAGMQLGPGMFVDPATGLTQGALPDDAIEAVTVLPNPYAVEFGRFSSGLVVIQTRKAADQWKTRLNNLEPAFRTRRHTLADIVGISSFSPRMETGGPIIKDKLFVQQSVQYRYRTNDIASRPQEDLVVSHRFSSFTRVDANLSPRHSLIGVGGFFPSVYKYAGLGTFTPPNAAVDTHGRVYTGAVTGRTVWSPSLFSETTVEINKYGTDVLPQGSEPMELLPETTLGNFFNQQERETATYQLIQTVSGTSHRGLGLHLYKAGFDLLYTEFEGKSVSRPVQIRRSDGSLVRQLDFGASGPLKIRSNDFALYAQDRIQPNTRWYLELGGRLDRDAVINRINFTPRAGAAVLLNQSGTAVIRSGYGLFFERTPSVAGLFEEYESYTDTRFGPDGVTPLGPPVAFRHTTMPNLKTSRSRTWDAAYDHRFNAHWALHLGVIDRRGANELIVEPVTGAAGAALVLNSNGRSRYREAEIGVHFTAGTRADVNASYARSEAKADLNAFTAFFDSMLSPVVGANQFAPARADAPNRLLARGRFLPTPRWLLVGVLDWRSGLPYSSVDEALDFVGRRNSERFPTYLRVDLGVEHRLKILGRQPWVGVRVSNALNSWLPSDVQANIGSPLYRTFYNSEFRQFRIQVRFQ